MKKEILEKLYNAWFEENFYNNDKLVQKGIATNLKKIIADSHQIKKFCFTTYNEAEAQYFLEDNSDIELAIEENSTKFELVLNEKNSTLIACSKNTANSKIYENVTPELISKLFKESDEVLLVEGFEYTYN